MDRQQLGRDAEARAATLLENAGLHLVTRNYRCRRGELDIVASDGRVLVVAEVRMRSSKRFGGAAASITWRKRRRIVHATRHLLAMQPGLAALPVRFDVFVADAADQPLEWIRGAFDTA
jgi:putative endonuclease